MPLPVSPLDLHSTPRDALLFMMPHGMALVAPPCLHPKVLEGSQLHFPESPASWLPVRFCQWETLVRDCRGK